MRIKPRMKISRKSLKPRQPKKKGQSNFVIVELLHAKIAIVRQNKNKKQNEQFLCCITRDDKTPSFVLFFRCCEGREMLVFFDLFMMHLRFHSNKTFRVRDFITNYLNVERNMLNL